MSADPLLAVSDLHRRFGDVHAVRGIGFELRRGEVAGLLGVNGAGKSTTLRMLAGVLAASRGHIRIAGTELATDARAARRRIGYLPEQPPLHPDMTVDELLAFCAALRGLGAAAVATARERCGLVDVRRRLVGTLSKGYRQRVGIAQAVLHEPLLLILDEPSSGLDPVQNADIRALVRELAAERAVILSTHVLPEVQETCSRVLMIAEGRLVLDTPLAALEGDGRPVLRVRLRRPPADAAPLLLLDGVSGVERRGEDCLLISHAPGAEPAERVAELAAAGGWGLLELVRDTQTLEQHFLRVACGHRKVTGAHAA